MSLPKHVSRAIDALPPTTHPMTQFIVGITACQTESSFSAHYKAGTVKKEDYWRIVLEDGLSLVSMEAICYKLYSSAVVYESLPVLLPLNFRYTRCSK